jgi:hypothetical protein
MSSSTCTKPEQNYEDLGRQMLMDQYNMMLSACWHRWPLGWKNSILNVAGFVGDDAKKMADCHWSELSVLDKNLLSNAVVRIIQLTNFVRGALL